MNETKVNSEWKLRPQVFDRLSKQRPLEYMQELRECGVFDKNNILIIDLHSNRFKEFQQKWIPLLKGKSQKAAVSSKTKLDTIDCIHWQRPVDENCACGRCMLGLFQGKPKLRDCLYSCTSRVSAQGAKNV